VAAVTRNTAWGAARTATRLPSSATSTSPPRSTLPRASTTASSRPVESVAAKRLFWRMSQSSSSVAARLTSTAARPPPWGMCLLTVSMG